MGSRYLFKMLLAGSGGCGKTTLLKTYTSGTFTTDTKMTIGVDFSVNYLDIPEGKVTLQIWDFGGEERFRTMLSSFCLGSSGCLLFFDLLRPHTFYELNEWIKIIRSNTTNIPIILLGTKYDLLESIQDLGVDTNSMIEWIKNNGINAYLNISSKTGMNVQEAFEKLTRLMIHK